MEDRQGEQLLTFPVSHSPVEIRASPLCDLSPQPTALRECGCSGRKRLHPKCLLACSALHSAQKPLFHIRYSVPIEGVRSHLKLSQREFHTNMATSAQQLFYFMGKNSGMLEVPIPLFLHHKSLIKIRLLCIVVEE